MKLKLVLKINASIFLEHKENNRVISSMEIIVENLLFKSEILAEFLYIFFFLKKHLWLSIIKELIISYQFRQSI